jgi:hypothetical protein
MMIREIVFHERTECADALACSQLGAARVGKAPTTRAFERLDEQRLA